MHTEKTLYYMEFSQACSQHMIIYRAPASSDKSQCRVSLTLPQLCVDLQIPTGRKKKINIWYTVWLLLLDQEMKKKWRCKVKLIFSSSEKLSMSKTLEVIKNVCLKVRLWQHNNWSTGCFFFLSNFHFSHPLLHNTGDDLLNPQAGSSK